MRVSWAVRVLRAAVFAVMCVMLAVAAHRLAMGAAPPLWAEGWGFLGVLAVACPLCGRERSLVGIGGAMVAVQVALHVAFDAAAAHLLAALAASWWLRRGESAFWSLLRRRAAMLVPALTAWWSAHQVRVPRIPRPGRPRSRHRPVPQPLLRHAVCR